MNNEKEGAIELQQIKKDVIQFSRTIPISL